MHRPASPSTIFLQKPGRSTRSVVWLNAFDFTVTYGYIQDGDVIGVILSALADRRPERIDTEPDGITPKLPRALQVRRYDTEVMEAGENTLSLTTVSNSMIIGRPYFEEDSQTISRMKERNRLPRFPGLELLRWRRNLRQPGRPQMGYIIRNIRRMETDVVKRTNPTTAFHETMNTASRCRRGVQFQFRITDGDIQDISGVRPPLLATTRIG